MNVEIRTDTPIFLFWEYLFRNFCILSLQCIIPVKVTWEVSPAMAAQERLFHVQENTVPCFVGIVLSSQHIQPWRICTQVERKSVSLLYTKAKVPLVPDRGDIQ